MAPTPSRRQTQVGQENEPTQQLIPRNRRRDETSDEDEDVDMHAGEQDSTSANVQYFSKSLVRYALACEHSRKPIKRQDINEKVLGGKRNRLFKDVFSQANTDLMEVFGMQMVELPKADRVTMRQKRAAAASESQNKSSSMWILQSILPDEYRIPEVIGPSQPLEEGTLSREDSYVGLYTMAIALITIWGGIISEGKLDRALRRMNADQSTPIGNKDKTLAAMVKDGYIVKVKETAPGQDETVDYIVGPRGKVEVGREGVARLIRMMYGESEDQEELEKRIQRTMETAEAYNGGVGANEAAAAAGSQATGRKRGRPRNDDE
ncbi:MAGE-domain-containing protein [Plenodomus tracheiphilus IPT5]|uniref:MAGE-domain-containing protein n=1 Tax=Plenodomus tracheiphilus IPT5 TaxID=1408161 RepID=A0A6A7B6S2_9PLEO|nr:MAGE-domain-containing protein [Plenodomus tracheiphilus IPT5]